MKELSIEEKAKRYDEKLDAARHIYTDPSVKDEDKYYIEVIFPELAESEDERIRKWIINYLNNAILNSSIIDEKNSCKDAVAWLEKVGEITKEWSEMKVANIHKELQDMVDLKQKTEQGEQKPAWSEEDEKLVKNLISTLSNLYARNLIEKETKEKYTNLLKSLKDRVLPQPKQEWSEEDEDILSSIIKDLVHPWNEYIPDRIEYEIKWLKNKLKSLRHQNTWKPSDEQMGALKHAFNDGSIDFADMKILATLYEQLKALHRYEQDT